jgi:hypothetical protein
METLVAVKTDLGGSGSFQGGKAGNGDIGNAIQLQPQQVRQGV